MRLRRSSSDSGNNSQDFEAASCLLLTVPGETTWRGCEGGGGRDEWEISSDVEGRSGDGIKAAL